MRITKLRSIADNVLLESSDVAASSLDEYASGTTYSTNDEKKVSFESDGMTPRYPVEEYTSLADSNTGNYPPNNPAKWSLTGASNRWAMFDDFVGTQTDNSDNIEVEVDSSQTNMVGLFRLQAKTVTLTQIVNDELITDGDVSTDSFTKGTGWVYDDGNDQYDCDGTQTALSKLYQSVTLTKGKKYQVQFTLSNYSAGNIAGYVGDTSGTNVEANGEHTQIIEAGLLNEAGVIADADFIGSIDEVSIKKVPSYEIISLLTMPDSGWYYYLYEDVEFKSKILWEYIQYSDSTLRVKIEYYSGADAKCGLMAIGSQISLGTSQYGVSIGFTDYSVKTTDSLGRTYLNQGNYADRADLEGWLYNSQIDTVMQAFVDVRGLPVIFDANNPNNETDYDSLKIYGFFQEPMITIPGPKTSKITISYEGLI